jgi:hypothetical protein
MRSTIMLGVLLDVIGVIAILAFFVLPILPGAADNPTVLSVMAALLCQPGETASVDVVVTEDSEGTGYTPNVTCIGREGETTDQTGKLFVVGLIAAAIPFVLGMLFTMSGVLRNVRQKAQTYRSTVQEMARFINAQGAAPAAFSALDAGLTPEFRGSTAKHANTGDLVAKLKQLEQARDGGLITQQEYDRLRQEILDKMA